MEEATIRFTGDPRRCFFSFSFSLFFSFKENWIGRNTVSLDWKGQRLYKWKVVCGSLNLYRQEARWEYYIASNMSSLYGKNRMTQKAEPRAWRAEPGFEFEWGIACIPLDFRIAMCQWLTSTSCFTLFEHQCYGSFPMLFTMLVLSFWPTATVS